jgi:diguanylate cyclase (GGDEF)-like protein
MGYVMFEDRSGDRVFGNSEADILQTASLMISSTIAHYEEAGKIREANERIKLMLDATPFGCQILDNNLITIDCNEAAVKLFAFRNKQEFIEQWLDDCHPEYQPDGQRSDEKRFMLMKRAIEEGSCIFEWMHKTSDGTLFPAEITLTRVEYENTFVLLGYTRDLREIKRITEDITYLKTEVGKIYIDPLTNIHNRRYLDENLPQIISSLSRSGGALSLMMIDIDHFKDYNDTYGHTKGDDCLKVIAATLKSSLSRADDFVVRYGGEEFTVVLPNTNESGSRLMAKKLLKNIREQAIPHKTSGAADHVTISIGVTSGTVKHTHSADYWLGLADEMLYKSKQKGRNRYSFKTADGSS